MAGGRRDGAPRVEVVWLDTEEDPTWQDSTKAANTTCPVCRTYGQLLSIRDDAVVVATTMNHTECSRVTIPRGCVQAIYALKRNGAYRGANETE
jgi:hypothetical protein